MDEWISLEEQYGAHNYHPLPVVLTHGSGVWVWDDKGSKYLDMLSAYSAVSHGHAHPRLIRVLKEQAEKIAVASRAFYTDKLGIFLKRLCELSEMQVGLPMNTGAEAVETAIKAARRWGYRAKKIAKDKAEIIVAEGNFHGRTTTIVGFSSEPAYQEGFGPFSPGFKMIPFGSAAALEKAINPNTCAFLVEPIQGEAGIVLPPAGWLKEVSQICKRNNVLLILDEVQSGLGRTGKLFAYQHEEVQPDGLILGKALGGGLLPVSAFLSKREVMDVFNPGSHGSTFGGNPLAAAVGLEAIQVLFDENLVERSRDLGTHLLQKLQCLKNPFISEVRGRGLWIGVVIDPKKASARSVCEKLMTRGILAKETHEVVVRLAPPLVITKAEIDWAVGQLVDALKELE